MSNPAVINILEYDSDIGKIKIEDNLGEAIHIHIGEWRFDLTINEFALLADELKKIMVEMINVDGFDYDSFDSLFLYQISEYLPDLKKIIICNENIGDLTIDDHIGPFIFFRKLVYSRVFLALNGRTKKDDDYCQINIGNESNAERRNNILKSVKENGYPYQNNYIILFNNQQIIRDGQHRAAALLYLNGNISVPIQKMLFDEYKHNVSIKSIGSYINHKKFRKLIKKMAKHIILNIKKARLYILYFEKMKSIKYLEKHRKYD